LAASAHAWEVRVLAWLLAALWLCAARPAVAQTAPNPTDPNPAADPPAVMQPLRLSLAAPDFLPGLRYTPGCEENAQTTGNSAVGTGVPVSNALGYQLSPRLSVLAFARQGCPVTAGVGGAAAYMVPIASRVALAWSAGAFGMPQAIDHGWAYKGVLRADVMWRKLDGNLVHTGIEAMSIRGGSGTSRVRLTYGFSF
jgi:hypothetical protein